MASATQSDFNMQNKTFHDNTCITAQDAYYCIAIRVSSCNDIGSYLTIGVKLINRNKNESLNSDTKSIMLYKENLLIKYCILITVYS